MLTVRDCVAIGVVLLFLGTAVQPMVDGELPGRESAGFGQPRPRDEVPAPFRNMAELASNLLNATTNKTDTDQDGLPDTVERALGTDPESNDSDRDRLNDSYELFNGLDPNKADSNGDHIPDFVEVNGVPSDIDSDGVPNAWDWDNDNDGVTDDMDYSPFAKTSASSSFRIDINVSEQPTFITFQFRTKDPDHLRLILQSWDWPDDSKGSFKDLDHSTDDVEMCPMLGFRADGLPDAEALASQGIIVSDGVANLPVLPVSEFGNIVAFKARMFYPESASPRHISANVSFAWKVLGNTDTELRALKAAQSSRYLSADDGGNVSAKASAVGKGEVFDWITLNDTDVTLRASNGICLAPGPGGILSATRDEASEMMSFTVEKASGNKIVLKASNDRYLTIAANGSVVADAEKSANAAQFEPVDAGFRSDVLPLATYGEDILLTGCRVEEDFGATAGALYGSNQSLMVMAALAMDCYFLRNSTLGLGDVPGYLEDNFNMSLSHNITSFSTYEEAMTALASSMPKDALGELPEGTHLPVILAMEDRCRSVDLSGLASGGFIKGAQLAADCAAKDMVTTRTLKTTWYNTSSDKPMELGDIAVEILGWNTTESSTINLITMAVAWCAGEQKVVGVGDVSVDYGRELQNINFTTAWVDYVAMGVEGLDLFGELTGIYDMYNSRKYTAMVLDEIVQKAKWEQILHSGPSKEMFDGVMKEMENSNKAITRAYKIGGAIEKIGKGLEVLGWLIDIAVAVISWFVILDAFGWNPTGLIIATLVGGLMIAYAVTLFALAAALPPVTTAIAFAIGLIDSIIGWIFGTTGSEMLINLIVKLFVKLFMKVHIRTDVGLAMVNATTVINDTDGNGLDVGDNITYLARFYGNVSLTKYGKGKDIPDSYIMPSLSGSGPNSKNSSYTREISNGSTGNKKSTLYETGASVVPGTAMSNFPMTVNLTTSYKIYYENTWFWIIPDRKSSSGSASSRMTTLYFDVMPGNVSDFMDWTEIRSNDHDGDGLNDTQEDSNGTSAWKWDTDADGLGDSYELAVGADPAKADTDGDGLNDSREVRLGTNRSSSDTDNDGLSDFEEVSGVVVSLDFCGTTMHYMTDSDPLLNDTDGDGMADPMEYYCRLNPRSRDTNGDGYDDLPMDTGTTKLTFVKDITEPFSPRWTEFLAMAPDGRLMAYQENLATYNHTFVRYDQNGTVVGIWEVPDTLYDMHYDGQGYLYTLWCDPARIVKYGASMTAVASWPMLYNNKIAIDSNAGILYTTSYDCTTINKYDLKKNMSLIGTMQGPPHSNFTDAIYHMDVDGDGNIMIPYNNTVYIYARNGTFVRQFGTYGKAYGGVFDGLCVIRQCSDGDIIALDWNNSCIQKFSEYGQYRARFGQGTNTSRNDYLQHGIAMTIDDKYVYVACGYGGIRNIKKIQYGYPVEKVNLTVNFTDTDGDGMSDRNETAGWNVTVSTNSSGRATFTYHVTSDPNIADTDGDGLSDPDEFKCASDARQADTDQDGLSDKVEKALGTNLTDWDTDGDGLDDGTEPTFGSDHGSNDTDGEGLDDMQEFLAGSNPAASDSDGDGLDDYGETASGSDPADPDSDGDTMFDGEETARGTDPNDPDTDHDGLVDGYETLYGTDPKGNDTDGDGVQDGLEVDLGIDPLQSDTDGDGLTDGGELALGLDPLNPDSDGDGSPDSAGTGSGPVLDGEIILVADETDSLGGFLAGLSRGATVVNATSQELADKYSDKPYIVLVGSPDAPDGTAGAMINGLLAGSGEMLDTSWNSIYVRYGVWAPTQTVVMLSKIEPYDHLQVLSLLRSMKMTVTENSVTARYLTAMSDFQLHDMDSVRATGSTVRCELKSASMFDVSIFRYNASNPPPPSEKGWTGFAPGDRLLDRFLAISLDGGGLMNRTLIALYYTTSDLDLNGDGDADDAGDINESTLALYWMNGTSGNWSKLVAGQSGVDGLELNTTDFELFGTQYQGVIWVNLTSLAFLGVTGRTNGGELPVTARAGDDVTVYTGDEVRFNGTLSAGNGAIANFTWTFRYENRTVTLFGPAASFVFQAPGNYTVTLTVTDSLGLSASDSLNVVVMERPGGKWILRVGPVTDENGTALAGALVNLSVGGASLSNTTDGRGMALIELLPGDIGKGARLFISKEGFLPVEYSTNITAERELERDPPSLVRIRPDENFTLGTGPVKDAKGNAIEGALVTLTAGGKTYTNYTDAQGNARIVLPLSQVGKVISVKIEKKGYSPVSFDTRISSDRKLDQNPPALEKVARPASQGGIPSWALAAAAIALVLIVLLAAVLMRRKRPAAANDEPESEEKKSEKPEAPKEGPPPVPPIEKAGGERPGGAAIPGVAEPEPAAQGAVGEMRKTGSA